jgi:hypothetical protein
VWRQRYLPAGQATLASALSVSNRAVSDDSRTSLGAFAEGNMAECLTNPTAAIGAVLTV